MCHQIFVVVKSCSEKEECMVAMETWFLLHSECVSWRGLLTLTKRSQMNYLTSTKNLLPSLKHSYCVTTKNREFYSGINKCRKNTFYCYANWSSTNVLGKGPMHICLRWNVSNTCHNSNGLVTPEYTNDDVALFLNRFSTHSRIYKWWRCPIFKQILVVCVLDF